MIYLLLCGPLLLFLMVMRGGKLKKDEKGCRYYHQWDLFTILCEMAIGNFDPIFAGRFIESKKRWKNGEGLRLMEILFENKRGIQCSVLAKKMHLKEKRLHKMLICFKEEALVDICRDDDDNLIAMLSMAGRHMCQTMPLLMKKE